MSEQKTISMFSFYCVAIFIIGCLASFTFLSYSYASRNDIVRMKASCPESTEMAFRKIQTPGSTLSKFDIITVIYECRLINKTRNAQSQQKIYLFGSI